MMPHLKRFFLFYGLLVTGVLLVLGIMLGVFELRNRHVWEAKIIIANNPDHRMKPNSGENNSDGIRCRKEAEAFTPECLNIIFLGDSFVLGENIPFEYIFPERFEHMANLFFNPELTVNVANFGWTSSSPYLSLRLLRDIGSKYNPDVVFLCIDMTDFYDDLIYQSLIERPKTSIKMISWLPGTIFTIQNVLYRWAGHNRLMGKLHELVFGFPPDRFFIVNEPLEQSRPYCKNIISNINRINEYVTATLKARFILLILPRAFQYSARECRDNWEADRYTVLGPYVNEPFRLFDELKREVNYPIYSLLQDFKYFISTSTAPTCFRDDPHWTVRGHGVAAHSVFEIAKKENIFAPAIIPGALMQAASAADSRGIETLSKPSPRVYYWREAEDADTISAPFEAVYEKDASEDKCIYAAEGSGNQYIPGQVMVSYSVTVAQTGPYVLWGRVEAHYRRDNSFFVQVDDGEDNFWEVQPGDQWHWDQVNNWNSVDDPVFFMLQEGSHVIKIKLREDGTKLDKMLLTNDLHFVPSGR